MLELTIPRSDASPEFWPEDWVEHVPGMVNDELFPERIGPTIPEFLSHAEWLDSTHDILDHSTCSCKKKPPPENASSRPPAQATSNLENGAEAEAAGRKRKHAEIADTTSSTARKAPEVSANVADEESRQYTKEMMAAEQERKRDLRGKRPYRKGELVWVRLPWNVTKPKELHSDMDMGIEALHVWPAIILSNDFTSRVGKIGEIHNRYDVKYCGPLDNRGANSLPTSLFAHIDEDYIFPFSAFNYKDHLNVMEDALNIIAPAFLDGELGLADTSGDWKTRYTTNLPFKALTDRRVWDRSLAAFAQAIKFSYELADMWAQTDGYIGQQEDEEGGMWWGAERIWQEELVRLKKTRGQIKLEGLSPAKPGAENAALFLKISSICVQESSYRERKTWQTLLRGDLYELEANEDNKPAVSEDGIGENGTATKKQPEVKPFVKPDALSSMPVPPNGYHFRKLNSDETEVTCDVFGQYLRRACIAWFILTKSSNAASTTDIAGRIYSGLDNVAWGLFVRNDPDKADPNSAGGIERVLSLAGKLPGKTAVVPTTTWIEQRQPGRILNMSASPSADHQPAPVALEADTPTSATVPTPHQSQMGNDEAPRSTEDNEIGQERERWPGSSSPLSMDYEDLKGTRRGPAVYEDEDEDMEMDTDEEPMAYEYDDMDIIEDSEEEDDDENNQNQENNEEGPTDRVSESTIQPHRTPSPQKIQSPNENTPRDNERMKQYHGGSQHEVEDESVYDDDDDAEERHSSVTSSTIPLTSLDDSPNQRHRNTENRAEDERQHHLVDASSSEVLHKQSHIGDNLGESSTLSSLPETGQVKDKAQAASPHHDDDLTDLSESEGDDGNEDEDADENDNGESEEDEGDENDDNGEEDDEDAEEAEENAEEQNSLTRKGQAAKNPDQRGKTAHRASQSPSLSPPSSVISLHRDDDAHTSAVNTVKNNGTSAGPHQKTTSTSVNGDEAKSPNKTLKLTLKLSRSPPNATSKENATEVPKREDNGRGDNGNQEAEQNVDVLSAQKPNPTPTSHGRKPSIFGSNTMEEEQQQDQDDAEPEDGELSEDEDEAGKTEISRETGIANRNKPRANEEESTEYSDAEEAYAHSRSNFYIVLSDVSLDLLLYRETEPQAESGAKAKPTPTKPSNQNTSSQTTSHPLERPPSTLSSAPSQPTLEALAALIKIEIKFAALRDQLYIERMNEITKEEEMVTNGTHRSLVYLHNILKARHDNLLRLADLRQKEFEIEAVRVRDYDKKTCMSWWNDSKDQLVKHEYESNARKRRRIEKDKHDFDMPKPVPKPLPPKTVTAQDRQARAFDWNAGPSITPLNTHEISNDLLAMGIGTRVPYRNTHVPALAGIVPAQMTIAPYGRNQALNTTMNGGRMPYQGEEMMMSDSINGIGHLDPIPPAAGPNHRVQQPRQHQPYSSGVPIMDQTIYGQAQAQARREGRQIPTSMDPFDAGRRRDRVPEDMETGMNGMMSGPGNNSRGDKHRRQLAEHVDFGPTDGPTTKKRKTGSDGYQLQASANPSRSLLDVKVEMAESGVDPRLTATAAAGSLTHHRSASPQHAANARRELAPPNPLIASAPGLSVSSHSFNHAPTSGFGATQLGGPVGEGNSQIGSSSLSAGPQQQQLVTGPPMPLTTPGGSISQQQPTTGSWGYRFPSGATPGMPSSENRNRFLTGMATARN
ncbi:hypothetical protein QFC21_001437 [Naganishia friedmannii]|uniref:Uncharacterized protein n=1 Tax=Naganishia friedmannii TaxID=89922 RepID=A0ACC2W6N5_9TREE|nr:hypothetical protein QFC21_001437 [Naganishia friedmannii]